jgi:hypothetical protein
MSEITGTGELHVIWHRGRGMPPMVVDLWNLATAAVLFASGSRLVTARLHRRWMVASLMILVDAALLVVYVFGEDSYRGNGVSRWDAYRSPGGALGPMFVVSIGVLVGSGAVLSVAGSRGATPTYRPIALASALFTLLFVSATIFGFGVN